MLKKKRYFKIFLTSALFLTLVMVPAFADITPTQTQQIQNLLDSWRGRLRIPAAVLSISLPDRSEPLTFFSGTTTVDGAQRITNDTLFQIGSISKSFTAMIILQLVAQNKIHLDDPITQYLPQYPRWNEVTIRELLNHTSGIFNYTKTAKFERIRKIDPTAPMTPVQMVQMASSHRNYFPPGKGWKYSNTNYVLAGMIIEAVTHQPVGNVMNYYLRDHQKLHLPNTFYLPGIYSATEMARMAHGYSMNGMDVTANNMSWAYTAGALVSTTEDLLTWWKSIFQNNILPAPQLAQMMSVVCEQTSKKYGCIAGMPVSRLNAQQIYTSYYGLGIIQSTTGSAAAGTVWWHNGSTQGYKSIVMWFPKSNIYMSLIIDRDPGYLLNPKLPVVRNIFNVLLPGSYVAVAPKHHVRHVTSKRRKTRKNMRITLQNAVVSMPRNFYVPLGDTVLGTL